VCGLISVPLLAYFSSSSSETNVSNLPNLPHHDPLLVSMYLLGSTLFTDLQSVMNKVLKVLQALEMLQSL
jgi:hypothetical protein